MSADQDKFTDNGHRVVTKDGFGVRPRRIAQGSGPRSSEFHFISLRELLDEPEESCAYIWESTLPTGGLSLCTAKPKVGKSTFARHLAAAIADGKPFLGRETRRGRVLYLGLEDKRSELANRFRLIGCDSDRTRFFTGRLPRSPINALHSAIENYEADLVIIDTLSRFVGANDYNDYGEMGKIMASLLELARRTDCHIFGTHHDGKSKWKGGEVILGSTAIFGAVDTHIQIIRSQTIRTISSTQRYGVDIPETVIEYDPYYETIRSNGQAKELETENAKREVLSVVSRCEGITQLAIKKELKRINNGNVAKAIRCLIQEQKILEGGEGKKGSPYTYSVNK